VLDHLGPLGAGTELQVLLVHSLSVIHQEAGTTRRRHHLCLDGSVASAAAAQVGGHARARDPLP
jgi:hypothetical protein